MGLPRYLKDKIKEEMEVQSKLCNLGWYGISLQLYIELAKKRGFKRLRIFPLDDERSSEDLFVAMRFNKKEEHLEKEKIILMMNNTQINSILGKVGLFFKTQTKGDLSYLNKDSQMIPMCQFMKFRCKKFLYWEKNKYGEWERINRIVEVSRYYKGKYEQIQNEKANKEYTEIQLKEELDSFRNKEYGRLFPPKLKQIIFERDNFTCRVCGKYRDILIENGLHLEIDHIQEWEDGGKTIYDNGQTICNECNKGKHYAKKYNNKKLELIEAR